MILALIVASFGTLADSPAGSASAVLAARTYDLAAVLPWRARSSPEETLIPYFALERAGQPAAGDALAGADSVLQTLRAITGKEFEYEGRALRVDESGRLLVKAPSALQELTARYLEFLDASFGAATELAIDVFTLPDSTKDVALQSIVPVGDLAKIAAMAEPGGSRRTYRLQVRAGATASLDATRTTKIVSDYDIEIAQAASIANPIVDEVAAGLRLFARAAPAPGGTWLALIVRRGDQVGDVETRDFPRESMVNTQDKQGFVEAPHVFQSMEIENRSLSLNTFLPDGKALVVRSSHESKSARSTELLVVRQTGKPLSISQRFQADPKSGGKGDDVLLVNAQSVLPPRCVTRGTAAKCGQPGWRQSVDLDAVLETHFAEDSPDMALEMIRPLEPSRRVEFAGAWMMLSRSSPEAGAEARAESGANEDPLTTLARCAPPTQVVQVSIALERTPTPSNVSGAVASQAPTVIARCTLPARVGATSCAVLAREWIEVCSYDVQVAQLSAASDPTTCVAFDGLVITVAPNVTSTGDVTLDLDARAHVKVGDTREFDPRVVTLGRMQQSTYDQLATHERLVFAKSDGGPRRAILGDASGTPASLMLVVEAAIVP
jgi:hypothetical protein